MASSYNKTLYLNEGTLTEVDVTTLFPSNKVIMGTIPAWFIDNLDPTFSSFWEITPPISGTYTYTINVYSSDGATFYAFGTLTLIVGETFNDIDICCDTQHNIVWFNRQGGWQNYIFTQRVDTEVEVGKATTFINNGIVKYSDRGRVYDAVTLYATGITKTEIDYLDTLRYCIQAYEFDQDTLTFIPILVDSNSFNKYNTKENMYEINISFKYATQLDIQKQ